VLTRAPALQLPVYRHAFLDLRIASLRGCVVVLEAHPAATVARCLCLETRNLRLCSTLTQLAHHAVAARRRERRCAYSAPETHPPRRAGGNPDSNTLISDTATMICLHKYFTAAPERARRAAQGATRTPTR